MATCCLARCLVSGDAQGPPTNRRSNAGGGWAAGGQTVEDTDGQKGKGLCFDHITVQIHLFNGHDRDVDAHLQHLHQRRVVATATAHQNFCGRRRAMT